MLADFIITIDPEEESGRKRQVQVKVYDNVKALRAACTRYENITKSKKRRKYREYHDTLGICHRFHMESQALVAIVRLAPPDVGIGVVSHELAHAAVWIYEIENKFDEKGVVCDNDERFCWILGELVRHTVNKLYEHGIYS